MYIEHNSHIAWWLPMMASQHCSHSVDEHFPHGAGSISPTLLHIEATNTLFTNVYNLAHPILPTIHDQQSLTLRWRSFSRWGIAINFAYNGGQWFLHNSLGTICSVSTQHANPIIVDAPLTLILQMGQEGYCNLICLSMLPMIALWLPVTNQRCDNPECGTNNDWHSFDTHFQYAAGRVLEIVFPIKVANVSKMTASILSVVRLPRTHDQ